MDIERKSVTPSDYWRRFLVNSNPTHKEWLICVGELTDDEILYIGRILARFILKVPLEQMGEALINIGETLKGRKTDA